MQCICKYNASMMAPCGAGQHQPQTAPCGATTHHRQRLAAPLPTTQTAPCDATTNHRWRLATPPPTTDGALRRHHQPQTASQSDTNTNHRQRTLRRWHQSRMAPCGAGTIYGWGLAAPAPTNAWTHTHERTQTKGARKQREQTGNNERKESKAS